MILNVLSTPCSIQCAKNYIEKIKDRKANRRTWVIYIILSSLVNVSMNIFVF